MFDLEILILSGGLAAVWMVLGVVLVARKFPAYSHKNMVMSELGAAGRPTAKLHPLVNNFPIAALFAICGVSIVASFWENWPMVATGILIAIHGVCHLITGLYPCDEDLGIPKPSPTQIVHNVAGMIMLLSLIMASALGFLSSSVTAPEWFSGFSLTCLIISLLFMILMARSFSTGRDAGLHQRISYGALVVWVAVFSGISYSYA